MKLAAVAGAVLCGGSSRRMGRDKALIVDRGLPLAERVSRVLEAAGCEPVFLVGGDAETLREATGRVAVADSNPGEGPLGGVVDALRHVLDSGIEAVIVAACDLPELTVGAVESVGREPGAAVAVAGRWHPSLARWPVAALGEIEARFAAGERALHEVLTALGATTVEVDEGAMRNVNRPDDLRH